MNRTAGMPVVSVDDLEAGMLLAEEVRDGQGRLLMQAGTELTDRHLRAFQLWGILNVRIRQGDVESAPVELPLTPDQLAQGQELVQGRLRQADTGHPLMIELIRLCTIREARRIAQQETHGG